jgi:WS/DGAT/MGAT family acyltransferase
MSTLDSEFLYLEDGVVQMHIGSCAIFEGPAPAREEFVALTESKLPLVPRYRQKVREVPLGFGRPVWVDDPHFTMEYHIRHTALPQPGGAEELRRLMGRVMSQPLDRSRPLWETWLVEGLEDDRWAAITKVHHSVVDGVSGVEMINALLDTEPDAPLAEIEPWEAEEQPDDIWLVADSIGGFVGNIARRTGAIATSVTRPEWWRSGFRGTEKALSSVTDTMQSDAPPGMDGPIGPHRRWDWTVVPLDDIKTIKTELGGTVNDVVLSAIAGGFRALVESRGDDPEEFGVRTLVPVSVRAEDHHGEFNNQVSGMIGELPVGIADPRERLAAVHEQMAGLKESHEAEISETITDLVDLAFPGLLALGSRATVRFLASREGQRGVNTVTTNVPGPQFPLYALGRRMVGYYPYVPIFHGMRVGVAILSYDGQAAFGVTGDYETMPDIGVLTRGIEDSVAQLVKAINED